MPLFKKAPPPPPPITRIGPGTRMEGTLKTQKTIELHGGFKGTIEAAGCAHLLAGSDFEGEIRSGELQCRSKAKGKAWVAGVASFSEGARWEGELRYRTLNVRPGARLEGRMAQEVP
ncbi:MAG: polymer-forming cytoskeletal protein [Acidobacteriota bacterium]